MGLFSYFIKPELFKKLNILGGHIDSKRMLSALTVLK